MPPRKLLELQDGSWVRGLPRLGRQGKNLPCARAPAGGSQGLAPIASGGHVAMMSLSLCAAAVWIKLLYAIRHRLLHTIRRSASLDLGRRLGYVTRR